MSYIRIFVGLGGFGSSVVHRLYKIVKEENDGTIPEYLRFVSYDSAMHEKPKKEDFPNAVDFMIASPEGPKEFLLDCKKKYESFEKWWPAIWLIKSPPLIWDMDALIWSGKGLGQYRPFGRLGFFKHLTDQTDGNIINKVKLEFDAAAQALNVDTKALTPRIIILNSLAGGTGSSAFIDVALLIKKELENIAHGLEVILFTVTGEASMKGRASEMSESFQWALANSYAALTELDYYMKTESAQLDIEYPRFGKIEKWNLPLFRHVSIICQDNMLNKQLPNYSDYIRYLANILNVIEGRATSSKEFATVFDNILSHMKEYGSVGVGSIHYCYKDALLYEFCDFAEESIVNKILFSNLDVAKKDLENDMESLFLKEDKYFVSGPSQINFLRTDKVFELLEKSYHDSLGFDVYYPRIETSHLDKKLTDENIQKVLRSVKEFDNEVKKFLNESKKITYKEIRDKLKSEIFYTIKKEESISYNKDYLTLLKNEIDSRIKGLEEIIPNIFEKIHLIEIENKYKTEAANLEKKKNSKAVESFRQFIRNYYEPTKKLIHNAKAKLEVYKNLSNQIEWYKKAVEEIAKPVEESVLKHYRMVRTGLEVGTYSEYAKDTFTIYALPISNFKDKYKQLYQNFKEKYGNELNVLAGKLNDKLIEISKNSVNNVGTLLEIYKIQPNWNDEVSLSSSAPVELHYDKREEIKKIIKDIFKDLMNDEFRKYISEFLPQNAVEALYRESKFDNKKFKDLLTEKIADLKNLVAPFVVLGSTETTSELSGRTPNENLATSKADLDRLFLKHYDDNELQKSQEEIYSLLCVEKDKDKANAESVKTDDLTKTELSKEKQKEIKLISNLDKITLVKMISGFKLNAVSAYTNLFKPAYEKLEKFESFADIRLKPGKDTKEIVFLLAEFYKIIEVTGGKFYKYKGRTLEKNLSGRSETIKWFTEERDTEKIKQIKNDLKKIWNNVPNSNKKEEFEKCLAELEAKARKIKDENLLKIYEQNITTMKHAIDFKYYENIHRGFE